MRRLIPMTRSISTVLLMFTILLPFVPLALAICYAPNGEETTPGFYFCNQSAEVAGEGTACCIAGDSCSSAGACWQGQSGHWYRGGCSDQTWNSNNSMDVLTAGVFYDNADIRILQCDIDSKTWCGWPRGVVGTCCNNTTPGVVFTPWAPGAVIAVLSNDASTDNVGNNRLDSAVATVAVTTTTTAFLTSMTVITRSDTATVTVSATPLSPPSTASSNSSHNILLGLAVGLGLGLPLTALFLVACWFTLRHEKRTYASVESNHHNKSNGDMSQHHQPLIHAFNHSQPPPLQLPFFLDQTEGGRGARTEIGGQQHDFELDGRSRAIELAENPPSQW